MINVELSLIAIVLPVIIFLLYLILASSSFVVTHKKKFSFLTDFPYETFEIKRNHLGDFSVLIAFLVSEVLVSASMFLNFYDASPDLIGLLILSALLTVVMIFLVIRIHTLSAGREKIHLTRFYLMGLGLVLLSSVNGIIFLNLSKGRESETAVLVLSIIQFVLALSVVFILINPRLKDWARLEKVVDEDGGTSLKRPKPFVLAFSEWIIIFLLVISWLLSAISNYLIVK